MKKPRSHEPFKVACMCKRGIRRSNGIAGRIVKALSDVDHQFSAKDSRGEFTTKDGKPYAVKCGALMSQIDPKTHAHSHKMMPEDIENAHIVITADESRWPNEFMFRKDLKGPLGEKKKGGRLLNIHELHDMKFAEFQELIRGHADKHFRQ